MHAIGCNVPCLCLFSNLWTHAGHVDVPVPENDDDAEDMPPTEQLLVGGSAPRLCQVRIPHDGPGDDGMFGTPLGTKDLCHLISFCCSSRGIGMRYGRLSACGPSCPR